MSGISLLLTESHDETGERTDRFPHFPHGKVGEVAVADRRDGLRAFADGIHRRFIEALVPHEVSAHLLADEIEDAIARFRVRALQGADESLHGIRLGAGENTIDLTARDAEGGRKPLHADALDERCEPLSARVTELPVVGVCGHDSYPLKKEETTRRAALKGYHGAREELAGVVRSSTKASTGVKGGG